ncbi:uncharacterized protein AB675_10810 [Cyphellophora attinorum]|uniref:Uncharacterized protein n=1 Tax=Cyphellophora attinorum TaxID=1664694 RepID=A0A0N1HBT0_9EURO|nr:uncharacterized protein AB675_10810 [Phialophora attinorum]KPI40917.1 hypothetical protein AB675_10810 [Phialophora attinorum]
MDETDWEPTNVSTTMPTMSKESFDAKVRQRLHRETRSGDKTSFKAPRQAISTPDRAQSTTVTPAEAALRARVLEYQRHLWKIKCGDKPSDEVPLLTIEEVVDSMDHEFLLGLFTEFFKCDPEWSVGNSRQEMSDWAEGLDDIPEAFARWARRFLKDGAIDYTAGTERQSEDIIMCQICRKCLDGNPQGKDRQSTAAGTNTLKRLLLRCGRRFRGLFSSVRNFAKQDTAAGQQSSELEEKGE